MGKNTFILLAAVLLLACAGISLADSLTDQINSQSQAIAHEGSAFVQATETATGTIPLTFNTVFSAFDPGFCGHDMFSTDPVWIETTAIALVALGFAIGLLYMLGQLMQMPSMLALAKDEAVQMLYTVLRVVFIFGVLFAAQSWFTVRTTGAADPIYSIASHDPLNQGAPPAMIDSAMAFCRSIIVEMITNYSNLVMYNMVVHTIYSSTMWFGVTWRTMYSFNLGPVLKPLIDIIGMALQYLGLGLGEWMVHLSILCMIKKWTWTLFIPASIFLRALPQTRTAGEALFAIVFALALVYPFMFIATYETHKLMRGNLVDSSQALQSFVQKSGILAVAGSMLLIVFLAAGVFFPFFVGAGLNVAMEMVRSSVYYVVILSLLLPFINIFVTLTAAREFAKFFNVDVSFMSFIKVI
jgi:hypothetical protein